MVSVSDTVQTYIPVRNLFPLAPEMHFSVFGVDWTEI